MTFQIKSFTSIVASMVNRMRGSTTRINDYNVGSVARTMLEAPAQEIEELYQQAARGLIAAIPVATYRSFNFQLLSATSASGLIRVTLSAAPNAPLVIAPGSTFTNTASNATFVSTAAATIAPGATFVDVPVIAAIAAAAGNTAATASFSVTPGVNGFLSASNLNPLSGGSDQETESARYLRFQKYIQTLARSTLSGVLFGAGQATVTDPTSGAVTEKVASAVIVEPYLTDTTQPAGQFSIYVYNGVGGTSAALVVQAQKVLLGYTDASGNKVPGYKAAGVKMTVAAAAEQQVGLTGTLTPLTGVDPAPLCTAANAAVEAYLAGLAVGASFLLAEVTALVMAIAGVENFSIATPAGDVVPPNSYTKLTVGQVAISPPTGS